jgi:hypothetical protein
MTLFPDVAISAFSSLYAENFFYHQQDKYFPVAMWNLMKGERLNVEIKGKDSFNVIKRGGFKISTNHTFISENLCKVVRYS